METVQHFSIAYTAFLDAQGQIHCPLPAFATPEHLLDCYQAMVRTRLFDSRAVALQRTGRLNTYASTLGQEAIAIGIAASMQQEDVFCPFYRDYGTQLMRGVKMSELLSFWRGNERGNCFAACAHDFPICVPIATQLLHATGVATAFKLKKQARVVVTTCGDGATSKGDFYEAINLAGVWQLPIVFVINNNQWAISTPRNKQSHAQTLAQKAIAAGIPGEQIDGNDVIAVQDRVSAAVEKARQGHGPSLIEALSYRLADHTTADDATRYRCAQALQQAQQNDPVTRLRHYLYTQQIWSESQEDEFKKACQRIIEQAVDEYLALPSPTIHELFDYHYAQWPFNLHEQRIEAEAAYKLGEWCLHE